jgi:hypothetical protein
MYPIEMNDIRHGKNKLWIDDDGDLYYGPDETRLICPKYLEITGKLPPLTLRDVKAAIEIGIEIGKAQNAQDPHD